MLSRLTVAPTASLSRLTQEQLAFEAEIDLTYVGGIERGKRNPNLLVMARIADALSVPLPQLLSD
jgi:transcriptional regulator with XRE-family HTH domain